MAGKIVGIDNSSSELMNYIVSVLIVGDFREKFVAISRASFMGIEIFEQGFVL